MHLRDCLPYILYEGMECVYRVCHFIPSAQSNTCNTACTPKYLLNKWIKIENKEALRK